MSLERNLLIMIMTNILLLQSLILWLLVFFNARLAQANLITKTDFNAKLSSLNRKITSNKSKHLFVENELEKLKIFIGKSHFEEDGTQNYLVFQPLNKYFKIIANKNIFHRGYLKDYLMKILSLLLYLIIVLLN